MLSAKGTRFPPKAEIGKLLFPPGALFNPLPAFYRFRLKVYPPLAWLARLRRAVFGKMLK